LTIVATAQPDPDPDVIVPINSGLPGTDEQVPQDSELDNREREDRERAAPAGGRGEDLEERARRALTDADDTRRRSGKQAADEVAAERARVAGAWLPVLDNLERALQHGADGCEGVIEGVRAVRDQAVSVLATLGFRRHDETGIPFDPGQHQAVGVRPADSVPRGTVLEVVLPGYGDGDRQLRPATVVVAGTPQ
jgi:molecular chaperone GrpE